MLWFRRRVGLWSLFIPATYSANVLLFIHFPSLYQTYKTSYVPVYAQFIAIIIEKVFTMDQMNQMDQ
jgi:hypothetical protein